MSILLRVFCHSCCYVHTLQRRKRLSVIFDIDNCDGLVFSGFWGSMFHVCVNGLVLETIGAKNIIQIGLQTAMKECIVKV